MAHGFHGRGGWGGEGVNSESSSGPKCPPSFDPEVLQSGFGLSFLFLSWRISGNCQ